MKRNNDNPVLAHAVQFSLDIISFCEQLEAERQFVVSNQLLKSGTSIGANILEAQSAESKLDFIHKMKIADKEAQETEYWLYLCKHSRNYPDPVNLEPRLLEMKKLLSKIISSAKKNLK